jgi:hypothetical protein
MLPISEFKGRVKVVTKTSWVLAAGLAVLLSGGCGQAEQRSVGLSTPVQSPPAHIPSLGAPLAAAYSVPAIQTGDVQVTFAQLRVQLSFAPLHLNSPIGPGYTETIVRSTNDPDPNVAAVNAMRYTILYTPPGIDPNRVLMPEFLKAGGVVFDTLPAHGYTLAEEDAQVPHGGRLTNSTTISAIRGYPARGVVDSPVISYATGQTMVAWIEPSASGGVVYRLWGAQSLARLESMANDVTE